MHRSSLLGFLALATVVPACQCSPPAVNDNDDDAGVIGISADAGSIPDAGADGDAGASGDAGAEVPPISGTALLQLDDGRVLLLNLASGEVTAPLGSVPVRAAVASHDGDLYLFAPVFTGTLNQGRLARFDVVTSELTLLAEHMNGPGELAVNGVEAATVGVEAPSDLRLGPLAYEGELVRSELELNASAVAYADDGELYTSQPLGTGPHGADAAGRFSDEHCGGLAFWPFDGRFLCARTDGNGVLAIDPSDGSSELLGGSNASGYTSATALTGGDWIVVGNDCGVETSLPELPDLEGLCPASFAEIGTSLFAGLRDGGLVELTAAGDVVVRATAAVFPSGVATADGMLAIVGSQIEEGALVMNDDFSAPRSVAIFEHAKGAALGDDGELWVVDEYGVQRAAPAETVPTLVHARDDATGIARLGRHVYVSTDAGIVRFSLDDGPSYALEELSTRTATSIAACADAILLHDAVSRDVVLLYPDATVEVVRPLFGSADTVGCVNEQLVVGVGEDVSVRRLHDLQGTLELVVTLDEDVRHIAPWTAGE